jgi:hypothetical protein
MTTNLNKNMVCDVTTGICGEATDAGMEIIDLTQPKKTVKLSPLNLGCAASRPSSWSMKKTKE